MVYWKQSSESDVQFLPGFSSSRRALRNRPAIATAAILNLAIGLAVVMTVFGWIDNVLLQPVPGAFQPKTLVALESTSSSGESVASPHPDLRDFQRGCPRFPTWPDRICMAFTLGTDRSAHHVYGQFVSAGFFQVLGIQPALGRTFSAAEDRDAEGAYPYAVISYRLWRDRFHADPSIAGSAARVNGRRSRLSALRPPFQGSLNGLSLDIWVHLTMIHLMGGAGSGKPPTATPGRWFSWAARVGAPHWSRPTCRPGRWRADSPPSTPQRTPAAAPSCSPCGGRIRSPGDFLSPLAALTCVSILLLLVACADVANLLLARSLSRQAEYGLRLAMGAGPMRLFAQMFTEGLLLAIAATGVGLLLAMWMGDSMLWLIPPTDWPLSSFTRVEIDARMVLFSLMLCLAVAVLSAVGPAVHVFRSDLAGSLRENGRSSTSSRAARLTRRWLVVGEVALSCMAIIGAGLFVRSFRESSRAKLGFDPGGVTVARLYARHGRVFGGRGKTLRPGS